jgi:O-antigen/teichoic acid export membrane protein
VSEEKESYRRILKATSLFGGVQVFNIFFAIIRSKAVAVLLGPAGMGFAGLLVSTTGLVGSLTNLGLGFSAVKDIAAANGSGDTGRVATVVSVFRRLVWITGLLGALATLVLSPWLSQITFGSREHTLAFVWLSCTLLFGQLASGQMVLLQGMRKLQYLAKANMAGTVIGLIVSLPLYYFYGLQGIVPAIIVSSILSMLMAFYWGSRVKIESMTVNIQTIKHEGAGMVKMGIMLSLSGLITTAAAYLIRIFISNQGGIEQVGLYSAGFAIINTYVGMVFTAMGTDYYPRLSEVANSDLKRTQMVVNQQAETAFFLISPLLVAFIVYIDIVILLLYSEKFIPVSGMIHWAAIGIFFKAASWALGFIFLAKGDSKVFFWNELISNSYIFLLNIAGYYFYGLEGLGISFFLGYLLHLLQMIIVTNKLYDIRFSKKTIKTFSINFSIALIAFCIVCFLSKTHSYIFGSIIMAVILFLSYRNLNEILDIKSYIKKYKQKFIKNK